MIGDDEVTTSVLEERERAAKICDEYAATARAVAQVASEDVDITDYNLHTARALTAQTLAEKIRRSP